MTASHTAPPSRSNYVVGRALSSFPTFTGTSKEDCDSYLREFEGKAGPQGHCIPADYWPNELFLKLEGPAKDWYNTTFTTKGLRPTWTQLSSGLQRLFGHRYTASPTWLKLGAATRLAHESGPEALQRIQTLLSDLALLRVPVNPGPTEVMCYILQGQLTPEELRRWMAQANANKEVSDFSSTPRKTPWQPGSPPPTAFRWQRPIPALNATRGSLPASNTSKPSCVTKSLPVGRNRPGRRPPRASRWLTHLPRLPRRPLQWWRLSRPPGRRPRARPPGVSS